MFACSNLRHFSNCCTDLCVVSLTPAQKKWHSHPAHSRPGSHRGACVSSRTVHPWMRWPDNRWMGGQICGVCPDHWLWCPLSLVGTECGMCPPQLGYWSLLQRHGSGPVSAVAPTQHVHSTEHAHSSQYGCANLPECGRSKEGSSTSNSATAPSNVCGLLNKGCVVCHV